MKHFHGTYKEVCDKHDPEFYPKFKEWADRYFVIQHRNETRGLGGIFFDDLNDRDPDTIFEFSSFRQGSPSRPEPGNEPFGFRDQFFQQHRL